MRTAAILPVKRFTRAKQRLGSERRAELAAAMVADVLEALRAVPELDVIVVSCEPTIECTVPDPAESGHNGAALLGIRHAVEQGYDRALLVPGDCPAMDPDDVRALLASDAPVSIVPDRHGTGTNALLLVPPDALVPSFGPGSFQRHLDLAAGRAEVLRPPSLTHDVDTVEDLHRLVALGRGAPRTRALLASRAAA